MTRKQKESLIKYILNECYPEESFENTVRMIVDKFDKYANSIESSEDVDTIYQTYPRKVNPKTSKKSISKAILSKGYDFVLDATNRYAKLVERYGLSPKHEKWHSVPHPTTWYNQERYDLSEEEWTSTFRGCRFTPQADIKTYTSDDAPHNWRDKLFELYPDNKYDGSWAELKRDHRDIVNEIMRIV